MKRRIHPAYASSVRGLRCSPGWRWDLLHEPQRPPCPALTLRDSNSMSTACAPSSSKLASGVINPFGRPMRIHLILVLVLSALPAVPAAALGRTGGCSQEAPAGSGCARMTTEARRASISTATRATAAGAATSAASRTGASTAGARQRNGASGGKATARCRMAASGARIPGATRATAVQVRQRLQQSGKM